MAENDLHPYELSDFPSAEAAEAYRLARRKIAEWREGEVLELRGKYPHEENYTDLEPLDRLPPEITELSNLHGLFIDSTDISDLAPLAGLTKLRQLDLNHTNITDLAPLAELTKLRSLDLARTNISDLAPLAGLSNPQFLFLSGTNVSDLAPLANLTNLQVLDLGRTKISDLAPLAGMTNLQHLVLNRTDIRDLTPLAGMTNLQTLYLMNTNISDLAPLKALNDLTMLWIGGSKVAALSPILAFPALERFDFPDIPALTTDRLVEISEIVDTAERLATLREYLLEEQAKEKRKQQEPAPSTPLNTEASNAPRPQFASFSPRGNRIETATASLGEGYDDNPQKQIIRDQIIQALMEVKTKGNIFPHIYQAADRYHALLEAPLDQTAALLIYIEDTILRDAYIEEKDLKQFPDTLQSIRRVNLLSGALIGDSALVQTAQENNAELTDAKQLVAIERLAEAMEALLASLAQQNAVNAETTRKLFEMLAHFGTSIEKIAAQDRATLWTYLQKAFGFAVAGALGAAGNDVYFLMLQNWDSIELLATSYGAEGLNQLQQWKDEITRRLNK